jgi:regulator of RNase E activity RraA
MESLSPGLLAQLRTFDTPTICNLIELFDVRPRHSGYMDARIAACFPDMPPVVGYAATATFRACTPQRSDGYASTEAQVERFADLDGPPIIVFQDLDSPAVAATFGEVMCSIYQAFGAVGLITSGAGRDLDQVHALGFPVFTSGTICAHGYTQIPQIQVPVHVGGLAVLPNDLLHADRNGVTSIPRDIAAELPDVGAAFVAAERVVLDALREPQPSLGQLRAARAEMHSRIGALRAQVSRTRSA